MSSVVDTMVPLFPEVCSDATNCNSSGSLLNFSSISALYSAGMSSLLSIIAYKNLLWISFRDYKKWFRKKYIK